MTHEATLMMGSLASCDFDHAIEFLQWFRSFTYLIVNFIMPYLYKKSHAAKRVGIFDLLAKNPLS